MPAKDAFCNELHKRFKRLADDAWAVKWVKRLRIKPPFHLFPEVVQKLKEVRTQAIRVVPLFDSKPWWKEFSAMSVDSIRPNDVKLYARDDTGRLRQRLCPTIEFLFDGGLISDGSCTSDQPGGCAHRCLLLRAPVGARSRNRRGRLRSHDC